VNIKARGYDHSVACNMPNVLVISCICLHHGKLKSLQCVLIDWCYFWKHIGKKVWYCLAS